MTGCCWRCDREEANVDDGQGEAAGRGLVTREGIAKIRAERVAWKRILISHVDVTAWTRSKEDIALCDALTVALDRAEAAEQEAARLRKATAGLLKLVTKLHGYCMQFVNDGVASLKDGKGSDIEEFKVIQFAKAAMKEPK